MAHPATTSFGDAGARSCTRSLSWLSARADGWKGGANPANCAADYAIGQDGALARWRVRRRGLVGGTIPALFEVAVFRQSMELSGFLGEGFRVFGCVFVVASVLSIINCVFLAFLSENATDAKNWIDRY